MFSLGIGLFSTTKFASTTSTIGIATTNPADGYKNYTLPNLLSLKLNVFQVLNRLIYGTKRYFELFPKISTIHEINNFKGLFPKLCAADDLEIGFGDNNQIEFFDNNTIHTPNANRNSTHLPNFHGSKADLAYHQIGQVPMFDDFYEAHNIQYNHNQKEIVTPSGFPLNPLSHSPAHHLPQLSYPGQFDYDLPKVDQQLPQQKPYAIHHSRLAYFPDHGFNMEIPLFDDFAPVQRSVIPKVDVVKHEYRIGETSISSSCSVSSEESYVNPLDDELLLQQKANIKTNVDTKRKRKQDLDQAPRPKRKYTKKADKLIQMQLEKVRSNSSNSSNSMDDNEPTIITTTTTTNNTVVCKKTIATKDGTTIDNIFECPHCDATFKVKGYLTRHLKKHNSSKAFMCPFYQEDGSIGTKCHPTGGFSRRDTFKTHLKALHFIYPPGTKSSERNQHSGRCAGCFQYFENNALWLETHIEVNRCEGTVKHKLQHGNAAAPSGHSGNECHASNYQDIVD